MQLDEAIWKMRREGQTFTGIALALGMSRQSVSERYQRLLKRHAAEHPMWKQEVQLAEYEKVQAIQRSLWPKVVNEHDPDFEPRAEDVKALVLVIREVRQLVGVDGLEAPPVEQSNEAAYEIAERVERIQELLGKLYENGVYEPAPGPVAGSVQDGLVPTQAGEMDVEELTR